MNEKKTYSYSYSAAENKEIKRIREKYTEPDKTDSLPKSFIRVHAHPLEPPPI